MIRYFDCTFAAFKILACISVLVFALPLLAQDSASDSQPAAPTAESDSAPTQQTPSDSQSGAAQQTNQSQQGAGSQQASITNPPTCGAAHFDRCIIDVAKDQGGIWTSPLHVHKQDFLWLVPFAAATAVSLHYDPQALAEVGTNNPQRTKDFRTGSDVGGIYLPVAALGTAYLAGVATHNDHLRETGLLAGEAMLDATIVGTVLKYATNRERPNSGDHQGDFWPHGTSDPTAGQSFPSGHAIGVWAFAHVVADEYPGVLTKLAVYGLATGVSASRVMAREHFPTDVLVGSVFGYLIGGYVYNHHSGNSQYSFSVAPVMGNGAIGVSLQLR